MYLFGLNYLSNRKFKVNLTKKSSEPGKRLCGVPQESILGPLLFLLYINDLPQAVKSDLLWDADDTCLIFKYSDISEIEGELNKNFSVICDFFKVGFTPCKAKQPLRGMELQEKEAQQRLKHTGNLFRKNLQLKDVC